MYSVHQLEVCTRQPCREMKPLKKRLLYTIYIVHIIYSTVESCKNSIVRLMIPEDLGVQISPVSKQQNSKYYYYYF